MTQQQEVDTLRVMLGKALGMLHHGPSLGIDDWTHHETLCEEIESLGIEEIGPPEEWISPARKAESEAFWRRQEEETQREMELHPDRFTKITRDEILRDRSDWYLGLPEDFGRVEVTSTSS
jgi:hypothetical protein